MTAAASAKGPRTLTTSAASAAASAASAASAQQLSGREVCCYSISCKLSDNIDITLEWLSKHAKS